MDEDKAGLATGAENPGEPTQGKETAAAGKPEPKFTDDDMAAARASWQARTKKEHAKVVSSREREILDSLESDSWDEIKEALTGKRQEQTELENQLVQLKRDHRTAKRDLEAYTELQERYNALQSRVHESAKRESIYTAAKAANAHEDLVHALVAGKLSVGEDGSVFVVGDDGEPAGKTVETLIKELVANDQRLLRAVDGAGGGSGPPAGGPRAQPRSNPASWHEKIRGAAADAAKQAQRATFGVQQANPWAPK